MTTKRMTSVANIDALFGIPRDSSVMTQVPVLHRARLSEGHVSERTPLTVTLINGTDFQVD